MGWGGWVGGGVQSHFRVKPNLHCIVLGCWLGCGFDNKRQMLVPNLIIVNTRAKVHCR